MLKILTTALFAFLLQGSKSSFQDCSHDWVTFRCVMYIDNFDGDTVTVKIPNVHPLLGDQISIRIKGIQTPEIFSKKPCEKAVARRAKQVVAMYLETASRIDLTDIERGSFFRIVADIKFDGKSIAEELLARNLAIEYERRKDKIDWCKKERKK